MAIPFSEFPEKPLNLKNLHKIPKNEKVEKVKKSNPNLKSLWAFVSSILIYMYVFYVFNLSPSTLICTTKFWFLISNTLVLIVAVDFAAFSQHEGHVAEDATATSPKCHVIMVNDTTATSPTRMKEEENSSKEKIINAVDNHPQKKREKCVRSNSANAAVVAAAAEEGKAMVLHRTLSEGDDHHGLLEDEKINEFSSMSNEEVNRRVEEFIRRFNRQIRLQAVINRQNLVN